MAGHHPWSKLRDRMTEAQRADMDNRVRKMEAEMVLAELRKYSGMTQKDLAEKLGVTQPTLSGQEHQDDMEISTLSRLIQALGGKLELIVHMPKGDIRLTQFDTGPTPQPEAAR
ncbi:helix-turn-helix domain-containing protein [Rhodopirellula baltica]|uniref:Lipoprotein n=1 Tax=Rhodopirellula baltica SWK14 TaxID=993516 RepID=L7CJV7_RHOBT|nr:helix-turn-helix transcriptional regulator [Rhodopirellula baltica]ELP34529.1 lipoprotein [Rhodopirellula baltica SWK14]